MKSCLCDRDVNKTGAFFLSGSRGWGGVRGGREPLLSNGCEVMFKSFGTERTAIFFPFSLPLLHFVHLHL